MVAKLNAARFSTRGRSYNVNSPNRTLPKKISGVIFSFVRFCAIME